MKTQLIVVLLNYVGIPIEAACIIAVLIYVIGGLLILGALISVINNATYSKRIKEQNEQIIQQNNKILEGLAIIVNNQNVNISNEMIYQSYNEQ